MAVPDPISPESTLEFHITETGSIVTYERIKENKWFWTKLQAFYPSHIPFSCGIFLHCSSNKRDAMKNLWTAWGQVFTW